MESCGHDFSLPDSDRMVVLRCDDFNPGAKALDFGSTNEDHLNRLTAQLAFTDGAVNLPAIGVPADTNVERAEASLSGILDFLSEKNCSGAGAEGRFCADERFQFFDSGLTQKFEECTRFAAGDDEAGNFVQLFRLSYKHNFGAQLLEPAAMGIEITLQGQDTDFHLVLIEIFFGHVVFRHFVGVDFARAIVVGCFDPGHCFGLEGIALFDQLVNAFRVHGLDVREALKIA